MSTSPSGRVILVGRPNAGKSSLFNRLTGGHAHVGNYAGVTVDILEEDVTLPGGGRVVVCDLPGVYSLEAALDEDTDEGIARVFLDSARRGDTPTVVVHVVDGTQLALGLRLTKELLRLPLPLVVVATQRDILEAEGQSLDVDALGKALAANGEVAVVAVSSREPKARDLVLGAVEQSLRRPSSKTPREDARWDPAVVAATALTAGSSGRSQERRRTFTARADQWLLHPVLGPFLFLGLMASAFAAVFLVADPASRALDLLVKMAGARLEALLGRGLLASFLTDGLLGGAGTVLAFLPQIVILTVVLELLEASGYLARGAFLVDRLLRLLGLSGRSFVPLLMGHACAVPAVAATRVIREPRERLTAILVLPLMTCAGRIPTYALLISAFFGHRSPWFQAALFVGLYMTGGLSGLAASLALRRTATRGRSLPLVMEMPAYRAPEPRVVLRQGTRAAGRFLKEVGTVILAASAVLWVLLTVPAPGAPPAAGDQPIERSLAAAVGRAVEPITRPVGFDWRIDVGLIGSFGARELMVGTLGIVFGLEDADDEPAPLAQKIRDARAPSGAALYPTSTGLALLAFFVLACQCMSTVAAIRRETRSWRWPALVLAYTYGAGYGAALVVGTVARALGVP